jgi:NADH-quinone oxidoreductase subunit N
MTIIPILPLALSDYLALMPLLLVLASSLGALISELIAPKNQTLIASVSTIGFLAALFFACSNTPSFHPLLTPWLQFDFLSSFFSGIFLVIGLFVLWMSLPFFSQIGASRAEFHFFISASVFGLMLIGSANDFLTLFLGLEILSISLYVLCGYLKPVKISHEAAFKYFLLGSVSTAFLLFGIALVYGACGSTKLHALATPQNSSLFFLGISFITLSFLFKAALVPFHFWAPDVYTGASHPVTAFMAVGTKVGAFAAFMRVFMASQEPFSSLWNDTMAFFVYPSILYANFVAMRQNNLKRFFAYSGIVHAGFLLIGVASGGYNVAPTVLYYLTMYSAATLGAFAAIAFLDREGKGVTIEDLRGLFASSPSLAFVFTLCLLTLAGIPPTAGFFAKLYIFKAAFSAHYYGLVIVGLIMSIVSAYYYLRLISWMFVEAPLPTKEKANLPCFVVGFSCVVSLLFLSIYPRLELF